MIALGIYSRMGGMERFNRRVVRCLAELGGKTISDSHVVSLWDEPVHRAGVPGNVGFFPGRSSKTRTAAHFLRQVQMIQPDVVLYGHVMLAPLAALARTVSPNSHQVLFVHGTEVWDDSDYRRVPLWEIVAVQECVDRVVSVSHFTAARMARAFRLSDSRFRLLPNAVDVQGSGYRPTTNHKNWQPSVLLTVARLSARDRYKGIDKVILAMPRVLSVLPQARYDIVGEGPLRSELRSLAERTGVANRVRFLGYLDDGQIQNAYASSHVFVMPSSGEGFGIVFLEAWKHNLPVICGNRDASSEVVVNGRNGLTVDPLDLEQIAEAAIRLLSDPDLAASYGNHGLQTVSELYSHEAFQSRLEAILLDHCTRDRIAPKGTAVLP